MPIHAYKRRLMKIEKIILECPGMVLSNKDTFRILELCRPSPLVENEDNKNSRNETPRPVGVGKGTGV